MSILSQIQPFIQAYVCAVSAILDGEVTIIDDELIRIGGSGIYEERIGLPISHTSFFQKILKTGEPGIIPDVRAESWCVSCEKREACRELANLGYPIYYGTKIIGVIGIIAFGEKARDNLITNQKKLREFAKYMSILIENRIQSLEYANKLELRLQEEAQSHLPPSFIANSEKMAGILQLARRVAPSSSTVLITGESGVGKEVLAKHLHANSTRKNAPMVCINCGAIPENLVESELFGYEGGSFTGSKKSGAIGKFELADGGTLFLDEIGELPLPAQTKLLRFLQERVIERVGGTKPILVDVRIICATNQDLPQMIAQHRFREDLYYRLNVIPMQLPPLRERTEDIGPLLSYYLDFFNRQLRKSIRGFEPDVAETLESYQWPGNIRELRNIVEYLVNMAPGEYIRMADIPVHIRHTQTTDTERTLSSIMEEYERSVLGKYSQKYVTTEEKTSLAAQLGISRATLYRKLAAYGLL